jgi:hypothetical protein
METIVIVLLYLRANEDVETTEDQVSNNFFLTDTCLIVPHHYLIVVGKIINYR